ncbi:glycosyltransferase family 9 protein [Ectothiorhodospira variabilis]|uniref:glycosyltransferase family 9 protein n=1 Tax=Ectothiorhodospira variabilis TaxID=505694 RepID=UPI001EFC1A91|nr:glycosyltransferase family 9 protein [Ectothiorhodospira variabilis]MCG5493456.1 glycosyltransferase family 9 protein [Ectothiorhodospira variabilis]MCG5496802.1 glycosyltransferase family 9 protein [Ectothiorhodospira variabilis]MCG5502785.1 glycosyltransferase family 9 protein [Ectothiorhodospira variabilis]MCG5506427.1 glycosyltransferase family 9 protein [Ectothiorhodospira variabilis]
MTSKVPTFLFIRLSAIGDIVMASPLPAALKSAYPDAKIVWLVEPQARRLVEQHEHVDRVVVWSKDRWVALLRKFSWFQLIREVRGFHRELRGERYDVAVDLQGLLKSGILARLSGAPVRVGLGAREGGQYLMTHVIPRGGDPRRIGSEYLFLAQELGWESDEFRMHVGLSASDEEQARVLSRSHPTGYIVACPFTTRPQKHWIEDRWAELAKRLNGIYGLTVVLLGGGGDKASAERIAARAGPAVDNQVGATTITGAAAIIRHSRLLIGVDTGLTHMGPAFDVPTVALFGSTCPYLDTGRDNTVVIYHDLPCSPCKRNPTCDGRFDCLRNIQVDEVIRSIEGLPRLGKGR